MTKPSDRQSFPGGVGRDDSIEDHGPVPVTARFAEHMLGQATADTRPECAGSTMKAALATAAAGRRSWV